MSGSGEFAAKRVRPAAIATAVLTATLFFGAMAGPASAEDRDHGRDHRDYGRHEWNRGNYYRAPPVVYGTPYYQPYYAPPVVYGPGFGLNFNFR